MKLGFVTAILDSWTYEEMMDFASEQGFECVEVACWPQEKAERRYAGVSHIDAERVNQDDTMQSISWNMQKNQEWRSRHWPIIQT